MTTTTRLHRPAKIPGSTAALSLGLMGFLNAAALGQTTGPKSATELLPPNSLVAIASDDFARYLDGLCRQPLGQILAEEEVQEFLELPLASLMADLEVNPQNEDDKLFWEFVSTVFDARPRRAFFATTPETQSEDEPFGLGFLVGIEDAPETLSTRSPDDAHDDPTDPKDHSIVRPISEWLSDLVDSGKLSVEAKVTQSGRPYERYARTEPSSATSFVVCRGCDTSPSNLMLVASDVGVLERCLARLDSSAQPSLANNSACRSMRSRLGMDGNGVGRESDNREGALFAFMNVAGIVDFVEQANESQAGGEEEGFSDADREAWDIFDLNAFTALGTVFTSKDGLAHSRVCIDLDSDTQGIFSLFPSLPLDRQFVSIAPIDVLRCWSFHFDLAAGMRIAEALTLVEHANDHGSWDETLKAFDDQFGVPISADLLQNLGPRYLFLNSKGSLIPAYMLVVQSGRPNDAHNAVDALLDIALTEFDDSLPISKIEYRGATITSLNFGIATPNVAAANGVVILSSDIQATKRLIRQMEERGPSILDRPEVADALADLGPDITPVGIDFVDTGSFFEHWYGLISMAVTMASDEEIEIPIDLDLLPFIDTISQHLHPSITLSLATADGVRFDFSGPLPQELTAGVIGSIAIAGLFGAAQSVKEVFDEGNQRAAEAQMKNFQGAIGQYRSVHGGRLPRSLHELAQPDNENFGESYIDEVPDDPWGNPFQYKVIGNRYQIISFGADGVPGGEGENEDIQLASPRKS